MDRDSPEGIRSGTMWAWTNALWVSFFYSRAGDSESVKRFLGEDNLARDVQADGTSILTFIERAGGKRPGCWAHARRCLVRCARSGDRVVFEGVRLMAPLFETVRASKAARDTAEQRKQRRQRESKARVEAIRAWVEQQRDITPPMTQFGKALLPQPHFRVKCAVGERVTEHLAFCEGAIVSPLVPRRRKPTDTISRSA